MSLQVKSPIAGTADVTGSWVPPPVAFRFQRATMCQIRTVH